jgi:phosphoribosylanthranilate isomerase
MPLRVKICGITNRDDAHAAIDAGADALGFILYEKSKRFISIENAIRIIETLPPFVQTVAVTVNATREFTNLGWRKQLKTFNLAQLHGQESPVHVRAVAKYLPIIKVFPADQAKFIHKESNLSSGWQVGSTYSEGTGYFLNEYEPLISAFMLDTPSKDHGGTGMAFDWNLAVEFTKKTSKPLILSGGLNPGNVAKAVEIVHPYAVDVSSGVEASPGKKDQAKLRDFIRICKSL